MPCALLEAAEINQLAVAVESRNDYEPKMTLTNHGFKAVKKCPRCLALAPSHFPPSYPLSW
jgi:hypothetical protein